jgi:hypothetical protein
MWNESPLGRLPWGLFIEVEIPFIDDTSKGSYFHYKNQWFDNY